LEVSVEVGDEAAGEVGVGDGEVERTTSSACDGIRTSPFN
jgi:hypothetical protein